MSPRLLAVTLCLAAATTGCGGANSDPRAGSDGKAQPSTAPATLTPVTTTSTSPPLVLASPTLGDSASGDDPAAAFQALAGPRADTLQFSTSGMGGHSEVQWSAAESTLFYRSAEMGRPLEEWERHPSREEWARFWRVVGAAGAWEWKADYGTATHTDCGEWRLSLQHGGKTLNSRGCSVGPDDASFSQVMDALTRLRGDASAASGQAVELSKRLTRSSDWDTRRDTVRELGAMGPAAGPAAPALVALLATAPMSPRSAAAGPAAGRMVSAVDSLMAEADDALTRGEWDEAIRLYDRILARDPQNVRAAGARSASIRDRDSSRARATRRGQPSPAPTDERAKRAAQLADIAESALINIGPAAVPALIQALDGTNPRLQVRAARTLMGIGVEAKSAVPALTRLLDDPAVRQPAARALARIDPRSVTGYLPVLILGLGDPDADVARLSVEALADLRTPAAVPALIHALEDDRIHDMAVEGLRRLGPRAATAVPALVKFLHDERRQMRWTAASALGAMGPAATEAIPALIDSMRDVDGAVRDAAARALGSMGPAASAAVPVLIDNLRYGDAGYSVGTAASIGLAKIGLPAVPALTAALRCDRLGPATPMSRTGYQGPVYPETENVRVFAAHALLLMGPPAKDAVPALKEALRDSSTRVRDEATRALREIDRP